MVKLLETCPAAPANRPLVAGIEQAPARNARAREEEVEE
jgi:hypothetical protein